METDIEEWRPVPGYEGHYEISSKGRIRSLDRVVTQVMVRKLKGKMLKPQRVHGYPVIALSKPEEGKKQRFLHALVCEAFHGPAPEWAEVVAHRDGSRDNNVAENVRWATAKENSEDRVRHGTQVRGVDQHCSKLTHEQVRQIRSTRRPDKEYADLFGVSKTAVNCARRRLTWTHVEDL